MESETIDLPAIDAIEHDLRTILRLRIDSFIPSHVSTLTGLGSLAKLPDRAPTGAEIQAGLRAAIAQIPRADLRVAARAAYGDSDESFNKTLPERRTLAGARCTPPVAPGTFREKGGLETVIVHHMASALLDGEYVFRETGQRPILGIPTSEIGRRPWFVLHTEQRLGYRWLRCLKELSGDFHMGWTETTTIDIVSLDENTAAFEYVYPAMDGNEAITVEERIAAPGEVTNIPTLDKFKPVKDVFITLEDVGYMYDLRIWVARVPFMQLRTGRKRSYRITREVSMADSGEWRNLRTGIFSHVVPAFDEMESIEWQMTTRPATASGCNGCNAVFFGEAFYTVGPGQTIEIGVLDVQRNGNVWTCRIDRPIAGARYMLRRVMRRPGHESLGVPI